MTDTCRVPWAWGFNTFPEALQMLMHWKATIESYIVTCADKTLNFLIRLAWMRMSIRVFALRICPECQYWFYWRNYLIQGSNMVFHVLIFARSRGRCWKPRPKAAVFNTSQGTWRMSMHWKAMFGRYYCMKTENICYITRYFLHYFVSPFHRCLANVIPTDYAPSRSEQYTSRNGSKSVAPVRSYWKLRSRALTARELSC